MSEERAVQTMSCFLRESQELTYVLDGDSLKDVVTLMVMKGYSQIPVLHNKIAVPREMSIVGVITWESIGKCMTTGGNSLDTLKVADCMLPRERIRFCLATDAVKDVAEKMADTEFAIVLDETRAVRRMVTYFDLASLYLEMVKPFSIIESIEMSIRRMLEVLSVDELKAAGRTDERKERIQSVSDLEFSEYRALLSAYWDRLNTNLSKKVVLDALEDVNMIRNAVMHFRPEGVSPSDAKLLQEVKSLLSMSVKG